MARATDSDGNIQPTDRDKDLRNYRIHHTIPIEIEVK
jgi:hypothetical protein